MSSTTFLVKVKGQSDFAFAALLLLKKCFTIFMKWCLKIINLLFRGKFVKIAQTLSLENTANL